VHYTKNHTNSTDGISMASFTKRGDQWRAQVLKRGIRATKTFRTKAEAIFWANQREAEIETGQPIFAADNNSMHAALLRFYTNVTPGRRGYRWEQVRLKRFMRELPFVERPIAYIQPEEIANWRDQRLKQVKGTSVRRDMNLLRAVFEIARKEWRWLKVNPMDDVSKPPEARPRTRIISDDETQRLCEALGYFGGRPETMQHDVALAMLLALETAMRAGELFGLEWARVHAGKRYIELLDGTTKNLDRREVPLSKRAIEILDLMRGRGDKVFKVSQSSADALFRKAKHRIKLSNLHFHDLRATALTRLARKLDVLELAKMIGHRDPRSLMIYFREEAATIAARLD
jgi:integrase